MTHAPDLHIATWNILYDNRPATTVKPQAARHEQHAHALLALQKPLDVVGLSEVEGASRHENFGAKIAALTGNNKGFWAPHSRPNEHIGVFGAKVNTAQFIGLGGNVVAAVTTIGLVTIAQVHLTYALTSFSLRASQVGLLLDALGGPRQAVIMGDFNCLPWQKPRRIIESHGFASVFTHLGIDHPVTAPMPEHRNSLATWERLIVRQGFSADDIYIKGLSVQDAGTFKGPSDHAGVWARLATG